MTYQPFLIANFATGLNDKLQPWLIPDDAQEQLFDGDVYRGVMSKRDGYNYLATGGRGGAPYCESRIVSTLTGVAMVGAINSSNKLFTLAGNAQIARGSVTVTGSTPSQAFTDDGLGRFFSGMTPIGTVNYITGAISITLPSAPTAGTVLVTYSFMPGNPVMMVATYVTGDNAKQLIVADTQYINRFNSITNTLTDITVAPYTGNKFQFFTWVNYASPTNTPRLLFCNNKDVIQQYDGTVAAYVPVITGVATLTTSYMVEFKDRLILLRTTENGTTFPQRIRISGTGTSCDTFDSTATGAGFIDIPDGTWIQGASFNRDDLLIFTEASTWVLKYTGSDTTPFVLNKIDESRGSDATFGTITYLNRTTAASKRGLIISDGYRVERQDEAIPDFTFNEVDGQYEGNAGFNNFQLCYAGTVDADRDHYLIYPPSGSNTSKRILTTNYDEDNYSIYRLPLSCMGNYLLAFTTTWNDLQFDNWNDFAAAYSNWNSFSYNQGVPFSVGGGQNGEIWRLSVTESEDNPVRIYNITVIDDVTIQVTTDYNNYRLNNVADPRSDPNLNADYIFLTAIVGMEEVNNQQFPIVEVVNRNTFNLYVGETGFLASTFGAYVSGGEAQRVIPFSALFKKFNPYLMQDKKVRCGWLYMYVDSTGTQLMRNFLIDNVSNSNPCVVTTEDNNGFSNGDKISFLKVGGTTELNGSSAFITVLSPNSFSLNGVDSTSFGVFTSGGYASAPQPAKMSIDIITNDNVHETQLNYQNNDPYQGNMTTMTFEEGSKKWYKVFINQTGKFIQFRLRNQQSGAKVRIQATMPGFAPLGRLI